MVIFKNLNVIALILLCSFTCKPQEGVYKKHDQILDRLLLNYTLEIERQDEKQFAFESYSINEDELENRLKLYKDAVKKLKNADVDILHYIIKFDGNKPIRENWVRSVLISVSHIYAYYREREVSMLLIDFYLTNREDLTEEPSYYKNMTFERLKLFLDKNKHLNKDELKKSYLTFVNNNFN